jgi:hypothetical protein
LKEVKEDVLLQIQGDVSCEDWPALVATCAQRFAEYPNLGLWSPDIDNTPWPTAGVSAGEIQGTPLALVAQTDSIVWAMRRPIYERLQQLDLQANNLGWGVDWAALTFAYSNGLIAVRDRAVRIHHPAGTGYDQVQANQQMRVFLSRLTLSEKAIFVILTKSMGMKVDI